MQRFSVVLFAIVAAWLAIPIAYGQTSPNPRTLTGHGLTVTTLACSPDAKTIPFGMVDGTIRLSDALTGKMSRTLPSKTKAAVLSLAWSRDGQWLIAAGGVDKSIYLWTAKGWKLAKTLSGHTNDVR